MIIDKEEWLVELFCYMTQTGITERDIQISDNYEKHHLVEEIERHMREFSYKKWMNGDLVKRRPQIKKENVFLLNEYRKEISE